jgi:hypothetical protein
LGLLQATAPRLELALQRARGPLLPEPGSPRQAPLVQEPVTVAAATERLQAQAARSVRALALRE